MPGPGESQGKGESAILTRPWLLVFLPVNAALSGFTVILPILILFTYHAGIVAVALAQTLYSLSLIPASMLWGRVCDLVNYRRSLLALNYSALAVMFLFMASLRGLNDILFLYAVFGWIAPSGAAASSLLIMERFEPGLRSTAFASFSEMSVVGGTIGILSGFVWVTRFGRDLPSFLYLTAALALVSLALLFLLVPERRERIDRTALLHHRASLDSRLRTLYPFFVGLPRRGTWVRAVRWLRTEATHDVPLILTASFLFNFAANLFNTSYTPFLTFLGLGAGSIFLVNLGNNGAQALSLPVSARTSEGARAERSVVAASWLRASGYLGVFGFAALLPLGLWRSHPSPTLYLVLNIAFYAILGLSIAFYSTSSSLLLFRSLQKRSAGAFIGANSALGGLAAVLGAGLSGVITTGLGYSYTFGLSALVMVAAVPVWVLSSRAYRKASR